MKKKYGFIFLAIVLIAGSIYGMKVYTEKFNKSTEKVVEKKVIEDKEKAVEGNKAQTSTYYEEGDFVLKDLKGNNVKLSDFKGKRVFLNFWATWCGPCKMEIPDMIKLYNKTQNSDLVILAVNIGESEKKVSKFAKDNGMNFTILLDEKQEVAKKYNISGVPTTFLIDENGKLLKWTTGAMEIYMMEDFIKK